MNTKLQLISIFLLLFTFLSCGENDMNDELTDQELLENLTSDFQSQTGIRIFYEEGDSELQNQLEIDHSVSDNDYQNNSYLSLLVQVRKLIAIINEFPVEFIEKLDLDGILIIDTKQPNWIGHAIKQGYNSVGFDGIDYLDNTTLIAHELFHIFDPGVPLFVPSSDYETSWSTLNPPNFEYGNGCVITSGLNSNHSEGFINTYSKCSQFEDRAIIFAFLYSKIDELNGLREIDSFLDSKANYIEDLVGDYNFSF